MTNKIISTLTKSLGAKVAWIGGAAAGITAVLSAIGFLAIRAHQDLLGITGLVPNLSESWTIEGAKFVYTSVLLLFSNWGPLFLCIAGGLLLALASYETGVKWIRKYTGYSVVRGGFIILTLVGLAGAMAYFLSDAQVSHLLVNPTFDAELMKQAIENRIEKNIHTLHVQYGYRAAIVLFFFFWLKLLPHLFNKTTQQPGQESETVPTASGFSFWHNALWIVFLILLFLLPMEYGRMVMPNRYYKVCLLSKTESSAPAATGCAGQTGWLLHKSSEIVLYQTASPEKPIQIFEAKQFPHIQVLTYDNIFKPPLKPSPTPTPSVTPTPTATPTVTKNTLLHIKDVLMKIPTTISIGVLAIGRRSQPLLRSLVLADANGAVLDTFSPFEEDERGYIQSQAWISNDRILFVEIQGLKATLKEVSINFESGLLSFDKAEKSFGPVPIPGWEPHLSPDSQFVIFRQGTTIVKTNLEGKELTMLIDDKNVEQIWGVIPNSENESYSIVFSEREEENAEKNFWLATIKDDAISYKSISGNHWQLLANVSIYNTRMLYARNDKMYERDIWNIYLSESIEQVGKRITNKNETSISNVYDENQYPVWSPDGSKIVYASCKLDECTS